MRGKTILKGIAEVPGIPELAIFIIPAKGIPGKLEECGKKGVRHVIIESGGFSEFGKEKEALEKEVLAIAKQWGIRILGPNCLGTVNLENGLVLPFVRFHETFLQKGDISLISQSGGPCTTYSSFLSVTTLESTNSLVLATSDAGRVRFPRILASDPAKQKPSASTWKTLKTEGAFFALQLLPINQSSSSRPMKVPVVLKFAQFHHRLPCW